MNYDVPLLNCQASIAIPQLSAMLITNIPRSDCSKKITLDALTVGSLHDTVCLRLFAAGLLAAGMKDEAAGVYYSLLQEGADRAQQVFSSFILTPATLLFLDIQHAEHNLNSQNHILQRMASIWAVYSRDLAALI